MWHRCKRVQTPNVLLRSLSLGKSICSLFPLFQLWVKWYHYCSSLNIPLVFGLVWFYGISTSVDYLMSNPLYTYISIYMSCSGWVLWHIKHYKWCNAKSTSYIYFEYIWYDWVLCHLNPCKLFNTKSSLYIYIKYIISLCITAYQPS